VYYTIYYCVLYYILLCIILYTTVYYTIYYCVLYWPPLLHTKRKYRTMAKPTNINKYILTTSSNIFYLIHIESGAIFYFPSLFQISFSSVPRQRYVLVLSIGHFL